MIEITTDFQGGRFILVHQQEQSAGLSALAFLPILLNKKAQTNAPIPAAILALAHLIGTIFLHLEYKTAAGIAVTAFFGIRKTEFKVVGHYQKKAITKSPTHREPPKKR